MKNKFKLLLCEDDINLGSLLKEYLIAKGFDVTLAADGDEGLKSFKRDSFDFAILDVMMPIMDGFALAEEIRKLDKSIPILFLTAKTMKQDTLKGFASGADDYMTKPFSMEELTARVNAILRRASALPASDETDVTFTIGKYEYDYNRQILKLGEKEQKLTTKENELLYLLCKHQNGILERNLALKSVWGEVNYFNSRSMDVYIAKLRKLFKDDPSIEIMNVHGKGFKFLSGN